MRTPLNTELSILVKEVYAPSGYKVSNLVWDKEGAEYGACSFELNTMHIVGRTAKTTPKKIGQFVTLWKRDFNKNTTPFEYSDPIDYFVINAHNGSFMGQFVFPKEVLRAKGILSSNTRDGKRGFRVYPPWSQTTNKTAQKTQEWQLEYFLSITPNSLTDSNKVKLLYSKN